MYRSIGSNMPTALQLWRYRSGVDAADPTAWSEFGIAMVGAAATLAGLVFVAISINLREILSVPSLVGRAGEGLLTLLVALVACALLPIPGQDPRTLGVIWIAIGVVFAVVELATHVRSVPAFAGKRAVLVGRVVSHQGVALLLLVAGASTAAGLGAGIYWIVPASLLAVAVGIIDAWVLLIEILR
jgi:modulator of FtsH protease